MLILKIKDWIPQILQETAEEMIQPQKSRFFREIVGDEAAGPGKRS
jgi:hypothetical protein